MFSALHAFRASRPAAPPQEQPMGMFFEVQLIASEPAASRPCGTPLTVFTEEPLEVAAELLRDRDPNLWDVRIRALPAQNRRI